MLRPLNQNWVFSNSTYIRQHLSCRYNWKLTNVRKSVMYMIEKNDCKQFVFVSQPTRKNDPVCCLRIPFWFLQNRKQITKEYLNWLSKINRPCLGEKKNNNSLKQKKVGLSQILRMNNQNLLHVWRPSYCSFRYKPSNKCF